MRFFRDLPFRRKLTLVSILTSSGALVLACAIFVAYDQFAFRRAMTRDLAITADMVGSNCVAALTFNDSKSANQTLKSLAAQSHIRAACIFDTNGTIFAEFQRDPKAPAAWPRPDFRGDRLTRSALEVAGNIDDRGESLGSIYLQSDLEEMHDVSRRDLLVMSGVLLVAVLLAWLIGSRLQRVISQPIAQLAGIVSRVATDRDYSVRAVKSGDDELGRLIDGFNHMLEQIEARDAELQAAQTHLERRVEVRTAALRQAQEVAVRERARFKLIFDSAPVGISYFASDAQRKLEASLINDAHLRICGLTREQAADTGIFKRMTHPEDQARQQVLQEQLDQGKIDRFSIEKRYLRPDGRTVWVVFSTQYTKYPDGTDEHLSTVVDITELKRAQEAAAQAAAQLRFIFEAVPVGVTWIYRHPDWIENMINGSFFQISGLGAKGDLHVDQVRAITHPEDLKRQDALRARLDRGEIDEFSIEKRYLKPDGTTVWVVMTIKVFRGPDRAILQEVSTVVDISERKRAELDLEKVHRQLLDASRQAGMAEVATSVLHNVGNVLNSVNVSATLVTDQVRRSKMVNLGKVSALLAQNTDHLGGYLTADPKGRMIPSYLATLAESLAAEHKTILSELGHLQTNIEHIKDIVSMQQSYAKTSGVAETISVPDLVEDALRMNAGSLARHDIEIIREYKARPVFTLEKHKVLQILVNLIRNAKYACDESGRIDKQVTVRITAADDSVSISVVDNGVGILPENLTRIFAHGFTTREHGHGFGLHSGALAAAELGGSLAASSAGLGRGATFTLKLPYKSEGATNETL